MELLKDLTGLALSILGIGAFVIVVIGSWKPILKLLLEITGEISKEMIHKLEDSEYESEQDYLDNREPEDYYE